ncbi:MAG: DUF6515 family protein [Bacteroidota bacterium]
MRSIKMIVVVWALLGAMVSVNGQTRTVQVYPRIGTVVTTIHKPTVVVHKNVRFHVANGVWYKARGRKYVVSAAPLGVQVRSLPRGNTVVRINGRKLYRYKGVWYKKQGRRYVVVTV